MARQRRFVLVLAALAVVCAGLQALTGIADLVLYATPLFLLVALLLSGHYVGEERMVAIVRAIRARLRVRPLPVRWGRPSEQRLTSLLHRSAHAVRGPPALPASAG